MTLRAPFKTAVLVLIWGWMLLFVLVPNLLVIVTSFLRRDDVHFIRWDATLDNYLRLFAPDYAAGVRALVLHGARHHRACVC